MPRCSFPTNPNYLAGTDDSSPENSSLDYCTECAADLDAADLAQDWPNVPLSEIVEAVDEMRDCGPDHPPYSDTDYTCDGCGRQLTDADE